MDRTSYTVLDSMVFDLKLKGLQKDIYALIYDDTLKVKRLIKDFNTLIIKSDNKDYPDITVSADEANQKIFIVGKVIERSGVI